jgi:hypothetical protein
VVRAEGEAIFNVAAWAQSMRRCTTEEGTIMTKSLLTGMAVCAALALFAGNAYAYVRKAHGHAYAYVNRSPMHVAQRTWESLRAKGGPLHDCVHVKFPQCNGHDFGGEPND